MSWFNVSGAGGSAGIKKRIEMSHLLARLTLLVFLEGLMLDLDGFERAIAITDGN